MSQLLFEPITLRGHEIRNRIWVPPMCQYAVDTRDGITSDWHLTHLGGLARGGAGAVIVEATGVTPQGRISPHDLGLWNNEQRDGLQRIVRFLHSQGAAAGIQLAHAGRKASTWPEWGFDETGSIPLDRGGWTTVGPSPIAFPGLAMPDALDESGIDEVTAAFALAGRRAVEAGFDLIEVHAAHGYLLHEFLSPLSNQRTDRYGGPLQNRARFLLEVVAALRAEVGSKTVLLVRLSATDWLDGGVTLDETIQLVRWLDESGIDMIDVSTGANFPGAIPVGPGYQVKFAAAIKAETGVPVAAVGMITEPFQAEQLLATDQADVVLIGREMLRDPNFPIRAAAALGFTLPYLPAPYRRAYR